MPVVVDNVFSRDTYGMRSERLIAIQSNFASIQPELSAPAEVATWSDDCYNVYSNLLALSELETNESEGLTVVVAEKEAALDEMYQYVKGMGLTIYKDMPKLIQDYGFEFQYPIRRSEKLKFADKVIQCYDRNVIDLVTPLIPALMITRLQNARDEFYTALGNQDKERSDARHAVAVLSEQFERDTQKLNELKLWSFAMLGKDEPRMGLIGMVNPGTGSSGAVPVAPTNLTVDLATMVFSWDAVAVNISSYILQTSIAGEDWETIYSGTDNFVKYVPPTFGLKMYRVLGHNSNGIGVASAIMMYNYLELAAPENVAVTITSVPLGTIELTFSEVPEATFYKIFYAKVDFGLAAPALTAFLNAGTVTVTSFEGTSEVGKRQYYFVKSFRLDGEIESEPSAVVFVER